MFLGVELELECKDYGFDTCAVHSLIKNFACLKKDVSIDKGFEIVSAPATIDNHYKLWDKFFNEIPESVYPLPTCGMHVHASRVQLSDLQIGKMLFFIHNPENRHFIKLIAGRKSNEFNDYESVKKLSDGKNGGVLPQNSDRHTALNLNSQKTIECRIFRATKNKEEFFKNIEFFHALIKFTYPGVSSIEESKSYKHFCNYVFNHRFEYPNLNKFLATKGVLILKEIPNKIFEKKVEVCR